MLHQERSRFGTSCLCINDSDEVGAVWHGQRWDDQTVPGIPLSHFLPRATDAFYSEKTCFSGEDQLQLVMCRIGL